MLAITASDALISCCFYNCAKVSSCCPALLTMDSCIRHRLNKLNPIGMSTMVLVTRVHGSITLEKVNVVSRHNSEGFIDQYQRSSCHVIQSG